MTPYTDEQKADLAKRIEALSERRKREGNLEARSVLWVLARDISDGSFFEVQHD